MKLLTYTGGYVQTNGYILAHDDGSCLVIDAPAGITAFLETHSLRPIQLLLTHQHFDHVEDAAALHAAGAHLYAYQAYAPDIIMEKRVQEMGIPVKVPPYTVDTIIGEESSLQVGEQHFHLTHVPGHSPDSLAFHLESESFLFSGDALFQGSIGRTDLPGGNHQQLLDSIRQKLYPLPDGTAVFPGHGPQTSIGTEKKNNPFCPSP